MADFSADLWEIYVPAPEIDRTIEGERRNAHCVGMSDTVFHGLKNLDGKSTSQAIADLYYAEVKRRELRKRYIEDNLL